MLTDGEFGGVPRQRSLSLGVAPSDTRDISPPARARRTRETKRLQTARVTLLHDLSVPVVGFSLLCFLLAGPVVIGNDSGVEPAFTSGKSSALSCGQMAIMTVLSLTGFSCTEDEVCRLCPSRSDGTNSLLEIRQTLKSLGCLTDAVRVAPSDFVSGNYLGIAWMDKSHFSVLQANGSGVLTIWDTNQSSRQVRGASVSVHWQGDVLLVKPPDLEAAARRSALKVSSVSPERRQPEIRFERLSADAGFIQENTTTTVTFRFWNIGTAPLRIGSLQKSCACASVRASRDVIAPGESASISISVDATGRKGRLPVYAMVASNSAKTPAIELYAQGFVGDSSGVWPRRVSFGTLSPYANPTTRTIVLYDFLSDVTPAEVVSYGTSRFDVAIVPFDLKESYPYEKQIDVDSLPRVMVVIRPNPKMFSQGEFSDVLTLYFGGHSFRVFLMGRFTENHEADPPTVFFGYVTPDSGDTLLSRSIRLQGSSQELASVTTEVTGLPIKVVPAESGLNASISVPELLAGNGSRRGIRTGSIICRFPSGLSTSIPVVVEVGKGMMSIPTDTGGRDASEARASGKQP